MGLEGDCGHVSEDEPVASGDVLFVSEYLDFPYYQAINDALAAVDVGSVHDDAVLYLFV